MGCHHVDAVGRGEPLVPRNLAHYRHRLFLAVLGGSALGMRVADSHGGRCDDQPSDGAQAVPGVRTSGASMIAGYLGRSDRVSKSLSGFARRYADQTEADHAALVSAVERGVLPAEYE